MSVLVLCGCSAREPQWTIYSDAGDGFSVLLPGVPTRESTTKTGSEGSSIETMHTLEPSGGGEYVVSVLTLPVAPGIAPQKFFEEVVRDIWSNDGSPEMSIVSRTATTHQGYAALDLKMRQRSNGAPGFARMMLVGRRVYTLIAALPKVEQSSSDAQKFLQSFQLLPQATRSALSTAAPNATTAIVIAPTTVAPGAAAPGESGLAQPAVPAAQPASSLMEWTVFSDARAGFAVSMPGAPTRQAHSAETSEGIASGEAFVAEVNQGAQRGRYEVTQSAISPDLASRLDLDATWRNTFGPFAGERVDYKRASTFAGRPALDFRFRYPNGLVSTGRILTGSKGLYTLAVQQVESDLSSGNAEKFIDSFRLL